MSKFLMTLEGYWIENGMRSEDDPDMGLMMSRANNRIVVGRADNLTNIENTQTRGRFAQAINTCLTYARRLYTYIKAR